jgi:hypothetical protein
MSVVNSKKSQPLHVYQFAGAVARVRRGGASFRSGRRAALLGILTSAYANSNRGARATESRGATGADRS